MLDKTNTPNLVNAIALTLPAPEFFEALRRTAIAVSTEETRYYLNGVYLHIRDGKAQFVATDGHRLARYTVGGVLSPNMLTNFPAIIIPRQTVLDVLKAPAKCKRSAWTVSITANPSGGVIELPNDGGQFVFTAIDGTFPDYQRVIPSAYDGSAVVELEAFTKAMGALAAFGRQLDHSTARLEFADGKLKITMTNPRASASAVIDDVESTRGDFTIGFNAGYLHEFARKCVRNIRFRFTDSGSPTLLDDVGDEAALHVLMPMRLR